MSNRHLPHWALVAVLTTSPTVQAAEWVAEPSVSLRGEYDDNFRLTQVSHDDVWGTILDPRLKLSRRSELWDVNATGRVRAASYTGEDGLDTIDTFLNFDTKRTMERGSFGFKASQINDTTLQNEVLDFDTGLTVNQIDRMQRKLGASGRYLFTEATWIEASVDHTTVEYEGGIAYGLLDYSYLTPSLQMVHQLSPQLQAFGVLSRTKSEYDLSSPQLLESTTDSLLLGAAYDITETWKISGSVGRRRTDTSQQLFETVFIPFPIRVLVQREIESTGLVYDARLTREFETGSLSLSASRSVMPSSTGADTESTRFNLDGKKDFTAKLSAGLAVSYYQSSTEGGITTRSDNDRYRIAPSLTWNLDREMALQAGYAYTRIKREATTENTADSNSVFISLGYTWPRMAISR